MQAAGLSIPRRREPSQQPDERTWPARSFSSAAALANICLLGAASVLCKACKCNLRCLMSAIPHISFSSRVLFSCRGEPILTGSITWVSHDVGLEII